MEETVPLERQVNRTFGVCIMQPKLRSPIKELRNGNIFCFDVCIQGRESDLL